ncbi:hypothetical protein QN277_006956 [Acacia crassicarpa]|uniref:Agenet domain-containing protein n=1 Tax=Acacia crassicarpa TaxID=499986 RepID=A0AAE1JQE9_9FABA|nr:hypothetical protein QN277_006956 [Acacia crassicarpa]
MRLKKGTKVEVSRKAEMPFGCWRCAEIICGNGRYYSIRYDDGSHGEAVAARVPREAIRPCPPVLELTQDWKPGDVVEVCQNFSWSTAAVLKVLGENNVLVRLLGSSSDLMVNKTDIWVRQSWQNEEWIVLGNGSSMFSAQAHKTTTTTQHSSNHDYLNNKKEVMGFQNSHLDSSKTLKRKSHPHVGLSAERPQRWRATDNEHTGGSLNKRKSENSVSSSAGSCSVTGFGVHIGDLKVTTSDAESARHCRYDNEHTSGSLNNRKSDDSVSSSVGSCSDDSVSSSVGSCSDDSVSSSVGSCSIVTGFGVHIGDLQVATSDAKSA